MLESKGFRVLADVERLPIPYQGPGLMARRAFVAAAPGVLENVLKGLLDSLAFIRNPVNEPPGGEEPRPWAPLVTC